MEATLACARAGVTTGEWAARLREVFGEYRAPTGVGDAPPCRPRTSCSTSCATRSSACPRRSAAAIKILVGKPGLDGHSNGAEQIAVRARDAGMDVVYEGIRLTPARIAATAVQEGVHVVGLSILSGSHNELIPDVIRELREAGVGRAGRGRRDHPGEGRAGDARGWASRGCTRRRTSRSAASWATSWIWWRSATAWLRPAPARAGWQVA